MISCGNQAFLTLGVSDSKGITKQALCDWNGDELGFQPGSGGSTVETPGIHVPLDGALDGETFNFSVPLTLNGSGILYFTSFGREANVELISNWPDPSFKGNLAPNESLCQPGRIQGQVEYSLSWPQLSATVEE